MKRYIVSFLLCLVSLSIGTKAYAQCTATNTAFQAGESLSYQLYFNWKFVWMKAGTDTLTTKNGMWEGKSVYRSNLITQTSKKLDKFFLMRDTLESYITKDMVPLYYRKAANEGGKYYVDQVKYTYPGGKIHLEQEYFSRKGETSNTQHDDTECVYDMVSMMLRARSFKADDFSVGQKLVFPMADGRKVEPTTLIYRGKKNFKMDSTGTNYRCLVFSFVEYKGKKEKEIITFYITDDDNHMPVRLDMFLKFGVAKAYLSNAKGVKNPETSIISK